MDELKVLIITQKIDQNDDILGFFYGWLNGLAKDININKIYVIALEKRITDLPANIELYSLGREKCSNRLVRFIKFHFFIAKIILNKRVNIIFVHMCPEYVFLAFPYARIAKIPIVMWYTHGSMHTKLKIAHLLVDKIITASTMSFRLRSNKVIITGHGIDVDKFKNQNSKIKIDNKENKTILSVGRISPIKNYETLIKAADILVNQKNIRGLEFQIIGGLPLKSQKRYLDFLKDMVMNYNLEDYIQFIGSIPYTQIHNYYQNCDLFVSASNTGSLDKAVLEAMASSKVVLTSNEAFSNLVKNYSGILLFKKNDPHSLAERLVNIINMKTKDKAGLAYNLRERVAQGHSLDGFIDNIVAVFNSVIA